MFPLFPLLLVAWFYQMLICLMVSHMSLWICSFYLFIYFLLTRLDNIDWLYSILLLLSSVWICCWNPSKFFILYMDIFKPRIWLPFIISLYCLVKYYSNSFFYFFRHGFIYLFEHILSSWFKLLSSKSNIWSSSGTVSIDWFFLFMGHAF